MMMVVRFQTIGFRVEELVVHRLTIATGPDFREMSAISITFGMRCLNVP